LSLMNMSNFLRVKVLLWEEKLPKGYYWIRFDCQLLIDDDESLRRTWKNCRWRIYCWRRRWICAIFSGLEHCFWKKGFQNVAIEYDLIVVINFR
jgi:hypothetical protein